MYSEVHLEEECQENMILRWQNGVISNFEYLSYLNRCVKGSLSMIIYIVIVVCNVLCLVKRYYNQVVYNFFHKTILPNKKKQNAFCEILFQDNNYN